MHSVAVFIFGSAIGSFLNVLIYRMPRGLSIITPRSFCPHCKKSLKWYENIPILSFIGLGGKCNKCKRPISIQYPLVELLTALLLLWSFTKYSFRIDFFFIAIFFFILIVISGIDFTHQVIPDILSIPGIFIGLVYQFLNNNFLMGLIGALFGGGLIFLIRILGGWAYKKEVMGMGDVYLVTLIGAFAGFPMIIPAIFIAALFGSIIGMIYLSITHKSKDNPIPFGPFLSIGGASVVILHNQIIQFLRNFGIYF
ncbi:MAG: prepilin peptidase [candidate division WOR-3 bacterium]|nr:prepilin peptidase [candidate division WOR-3 bacterium]